MTQDELFTIWRQEVLPHIVQVYEADGVADKPARRESFNNMIDAFAKNGVITNEQAFDIEHPDKLETTTPIADPYSSR